MKLDQLSHSTKVKFESFHYLRCSPHLCSSVVCSPYIFFLSFPLINSGKHSSINIHYLSNKRMGRFSCGSKYPQNRTWEFSFTNSCRDNKPTSCSKVCVMSDQAHVWEEQEVPATEWLHWWHVTELRVLISPCSYTAFRSFFWCCGCIWTLVVFISTQNHHCKLVLSLLYTLH